MNNTDLKKQQFDQEVSKVTYDYKTSTNENLIIYLRTILKNSKMKYSLKSDDDGHSQCHCESHFDHPDHTDSHWDTHPDCADGSVLGEN